MIFSDMLVKTLKETPEEGELKGECCICGKTTDKGFKTKKVIGGESSMGNKGKN